VLRNSISLFLIAAVLSLAGCGESADESSSEAQQSEPVKVSHCGVDQGTSMEIQATNGLPDPTAYVLQLYWFDTTGRQADGVTMTTDSIAPGKTITFTVHGRQAGDTTGWTCDFKVLGAQ